MKLQKFGDLASLCHLVFAKITIRKAPSNDRHLKKCKGHSAKGQTSYGYPVYCRSRGRLKDDTLSLTVV